MLPSAPEGSFGSTIRVRGLSWHSGLSRPKAFVAGPSVFASPASAASCLGRGPSPAGPSSHQAEALMRGAEPRSETLRPVLVPPSLCSLVPEGAVERGVGSPAEAGSLWVPASAVPAEAGGLRSLSCLAQCAVQPPSFPSPSIPKDVWVRSRGLEGVTVSLPVEPPSLPPEGDLARHVAVTRWEDPIPLPGGCLRIAPEVAGPVRDSGESPTFSRFSSRQRPLREERASRC
jgi:hypothetical protein